jgi:hypothetical protein
LKLKAGMNQDSVASPSATPQGDSPLELESWSNQFKRGQYEYDNRQVFTYVLKESRRKGHKADRRCNHL